MPPIAPSAQAHPARASTSSVRPTNSIDCASHCCACRAGSARTRSAGSRRRSSRCSRRWSSSARARSATSPTSNTSRRRRRARSSPPSKRSGSWSAGTTRRPTVLGHRRHAGPASSSSTRSASPAGAGSPHGSPLLDADDVATVDGALPALERLLGDRIVNDRVSAVSHRTFASMRFRNYRLYFFSQIVSFSGTWMQGIAQAWLVLELTGSGTALGTVVAHAVPPHAAARAVGWRDRRPVRQAPADHRSRRSTAGLLALTLGVAHHHRRRRTLDGLRDRRVLRRGHRRRQPEPADVRDGDGRPGRHRQRGHAQQRRRQRRPGDRSGDRRRASSPPSASAQCFIFNAVSYVAVIIAMLLIRTSELHPSARTRRGPRPTARRVPLCVEHADPAHHARDARRDRHAHVRVHHHPAAARRVHVRRRSERARRR